MPLPADLDPEHLVVRDRLNKLTDQTFDAAYTRRRLRSPEELGEISFGEDAEIQWLANAILPVVLEHLQRAQELNAMLTGAAAAARGNGDEPAETINPLLVTKSSFSHQVGGAVIIRHCLNAAMPGQLH
ncbi:DUF4142 domain-containing protein [Rhizobium sp. 6AS6]|uniref:DUF4142 domain-containing protein n=1 Tax=Rhizobium aouanii TaxID=3118145 RepID=A0ABU8CTP0_9HYPH